MMGDSERRRLVREFRNILREKSIYYTVVNNEKYGSVTKIPGENNSLIYSVNSIDRDENSAVNMKMLGSSSLSKGKLVSL